MFYRMSSKHCFFSFVVGFSLVAGLPAKESNFPEAPDAAVRHVAGQLAEMNGGVLWDALPESYQGDLTKLARLASEKIDAGNYGRVFKLAGRIAELMDNKAGFIRNSKIGGSLPEENLADLDVALPLLSTLLSDLADSPIATHAGLQSFDGKQFFSGTVSHLLRFIESASALGAGEAFSVGDLSQLKVKVLSQDGSTASLETVLPGNEPEREDYELVEGRWLPRSLTGQWAEGMANVKRSLDSVTAEQAEANKAQAGMILGVLEGVLTGIESAETQEAFDQALQSATLPLMGILMMSGQSGFGMPAAPVPPTVPEPLSPKAGFLE